MSDEVYDAILDRPEPTDVYAKVRELEDRLVKVEVELIRHGLGH